MEIKDFEGNYRITDRPSADTILETLPEAIFIKSNNGGLDVYNKTNGNLLFRLSYPISHIPPLGLRINIELRRDEAYIIVSYRNHSVLYKRFD